MGFIYALIIAGVFIFLATLIIVSACILAARADARREREMKGGRHGE
jgi:hypothetical protein